MDKLSLEMRMWLGLDWDHPENECWEWKHAKFKGYGAIGHGGKTLKVHRVMYELAYGVKLSPCDFILHLCDNTACGNPNHLLRGNHIDNTVDQAVKMKGRFRTISENYAKFLYEKLKLRFEGNNNQGLGCEY